MITWRDAFQRSVVESTDFRTLFGRVYSIDEFRYYAYALKFESLAPALLVASNPNVGTIAATVSGIAAPTTNLAPGPAAESLLDFPAGAIILGITSAGILPQRVISGASFKYSPSNHPGKRDLYLLDLEFVDTSDIVGQNPIPEIFVDPTTPVNTAPPILADALMGGGCKDVMPARELIVTPGLGIITRVRSMVLPNDPDESDANNASNLSVHLVFHCMVPGVVKRQDLTT